MKKQNPLTKIERLTEYFCFNDSPKRLMVQDPTLADRAIRLLDKIKEVFKEEYDFVYVQKASPFGGNCRPYPRGYDFPNPNFPIVLGVYNRDYFENLLREQRR